jgi:hypothetical protein
MSIKTYPVIVNSNLYSPTWKDELYNELYQALYDEDFLKGLTDLGLAKMEDGEDFACDYSELLAYQNLVEYLILCKEELLYAATIEEYQDIVEYYDLLQIRKNFFCKYGTYKIFDLLIRVVGIIIRGTVGIGLDYMIFDPVTEVVTLGDELVIDGDFSDDTATNYSQINRSFPFAVSASPDIRSGGGADIAISKDASMHFAPNTQFENNKAYRITFDITTLISGSVLLYASGLTAPHTLLNSYTAVGTYEFDVELSTNCYISFWATVGAFSGNSAIIDNLSIKEIISTETNHNPNNLTEFIIP